MGSHRLPVALEGCLLAALLTMRDSRSCSRASSSTGSISPSFTTSAGTKIPDYYPARKPYRMASSFELGYEQPQTYKQRAQNLSASSYSNLFGVPPGGVARPLSKKVLPPVRRESRSRRQKPLPVNTLTGDIIGLPDQVGTQPSSVGEQDKNSGKRSAGGPHNQLW